MLRICLFFFREKKYILFFFQLPGFPLFGAGQTSVEGFEKCLEPVLKKYGDEKHIFWVNLRWECSSERFFFLLLVLCFSVLFRVQKSGNSAKRYERLIVYSRSNDIIYIWCIQIKTILMERVFYLSFLWLIMINWVYTQIDFNFQFDFNGMCCLIFFLSFPMFWLESHEDEWKQEDFVWMDHGHRLLHLTNIYFVSLFML